MEFYTTVYHAIKFIIGRRADLEDLKESIKNGKRGLELMEGHSEAYAKYPRNPPWNMEHQKMVGVPTLNFKCLTLRIGALH